MQVFDLICCPYSVLFNPLSLPHPPIQYPFHIFLGRGWGGEGGKKGGRGEGGLPFILRNRLPPTSPRLDSTIPPFFLATVILALIKKQISKNKKEEKKQKKKQKAGKQHDKKRKEMYSWRRFVTSLKLKWKNTNAENSGSQKLITCITINFSVYASRAYWITIKEK